MIKLTLVRIDTGDEGTFGQITFDKNTYFTMELPWRDNQSSISCIPVGTYVCSFTLSPRFKRKTYLLASVVGRSSIRIHSANYAGDSSLGMRCHLNGCIAFGERIGMMDGQRALLISAPAVRKLEQFLAGRQFTLEVIDGIR